MSPIKIGTTDISKVMLGTTPVSKVMLGTSQVWSAAPPPYFSDNFNRADSDPASTGPHGIPLVLTKANAGNGRARIVNNRLQVNGSGDCKWSWQLDTPNIVAEFDYLGGSPANSGDSEVICRFSGSPFSGIGIIIPPHVSPDYPPFMFFEMPHFNRIPCNRVGTYSPGRHKLTVTPSWIRLDGPTGYGVAATTYCAWQQGFGFRDNDTVNWTTIDNVDVQRWSIPTGVLFQDNFNRADATPASDGPFGIPMIEVRDHGSGGGSRIQNNALQLTGNGNIRWYWPVNNPNIVADFDVVASPSADLSVMCRFDQANGNSGIGVVITHTHPDYSPFQFYRLPDYVRLPMVEKVGTFAPGPHKLTVSPTRIRFEGPSGYSVCDTTWSNTGTGFGFRDSGTAWGTLDNVVVRSNL